MRKAQGMVPKSQGVNGRTQRARGMAWKVQEMVMGAEKQEERRPGARNEENAPRPTGIGDVCELSGAV